MITRLMSPVYRVVIDYLLLVLLVMTLGACAKPPKVEVIPEVKIPPLEAVSWEEIDGWRQENPVPALEVFLKSCQALKARSVWQGVCAEAATINLQDSELRPYFKLENVRDGMFWVAEQLYGIEFKKLDVSSVYPELAGYRLRGRVQGRKVVPYWCRAEIDGENTPLKGKELFWVADPVELFFLHIQGSGRISLNTGERVMVHYADQNGYPYRSIGKLLIEQGEMTLDQMSMQNIKSWAQNNPDKVGKLLGENPSYIFFSKLPADVQSPPGALDIPLTAGRSLAVDPRTIPLGAPVFIATTWPGSSVPLQRLMVAQDTGGAIKGPVRADFFWGLGNKAGALAGRMKQEGRICKLEMLINYGIIKVK